MSRRWDLKWVALTLLVGTLLVVLVLWPIGELIAVAIEQYGLEGADAERARQSAVNTLAVGLLVAVVAGSLGALGALVTERTAVPGKAWLRVGILLPILIPPFVSALSWTRAYGPGGLTDDLLGVSADGLFGLFGVVAVVAVNAVPLSYLLTVAALNSRVESDVERAARISGASPASTLGTITVPLLAPALAGIGALGFVLGINAFGVPAVLGSPVGFRTVTTLIYEDLALSARPEAFRRAILLATGLVVAAVTFVIVAEVLLRSVGTAPRSAAGSGPQLAKVRPRWGVAALAWAFVATTSILPLVALGLVALTRGVGLPPVPENLTFANFAEALDGRLLGALLRSVGLALLAATVGILLGAGVAALRKRRFGGVFGVVVLMTFAVPGSTLAVAMILAHGRLLRDTLLIILAAYVAKLWAVGHRAIAGSAENVAPHLYLAARSSGASSFSAVRTILVPMLRPALAGGWVLIFLIAFHEVTMSSLLYGPGTETLAVAVLNLQQLGDVPVSSALAVILTVPLLLVAIPLLTSSRIPRRFLGTG